MDKNWIIAPKYIVEGDLIVNKETGASLHDAEIDQLPLIKGDLAALIEHRFTCISELIHLSPDRLSVERKVFDRIGRAVRVYLTAKEVFKTEPSDYQKHLLANDALLDREEERQQKASESAIEEKTNTHVVIGYSLWNSRTGKWEDWTFDEKDNPVKNED